MTNPIAESSIRCSNMTVAVNSISRLVVTLAPRHVALAPQPRARYFRFCEGRARAIERRPLSRTPGPRGGPGPPV